MIRVCAFSLLMACSLLVPAVASAGDRPSHKKSTVKDVKAMSEKDQTALALSAAPARISKDASVMNDPHLLFVSVGPLQEPSLGKVDRPVPDDVPYEIGLPRAFLDGTNSLGPYVQVGCNIKVWFDANAVSLLVQGAPDLHAGVFSESS